MTQNPSKHLVTRTKNLRAYDTNKLFSLLKEVKFDNVRIGSTWRNGQATARGGAKFNPYLRNKRREVARILTILKERGISKEDAYAGKVRAV